MLGKPAQASMEYIMIAGFVALVIIPTTFIFYRYASDSAEEIDQAQIEKFGRDVVSTAETVYYLGPPSRIFIEERLPKNVQSISIEQDPATGTYLFAIAASSKSGIVNFTFPTKVSILGAFGPEDITTGMKKVRIEAEKGAGSELFVSIAFREQGKVFVTSETYTGNLGGLAGADAKCQALADAAGLTGTWRAWLSTATENAKDRVSNRKYVRTDGALVAINIGDLTDNTIANPINIDESGNQITIDLFVWTGTTSIGVASSDARCNDWTSGTPSVMGRRGVSTATTGMWTSVFTTACDVSNRLYCFER